MGRQSNDNIGFDPMWSCDPVSGHLLGFLNRKQNIGYPGTIYEANTDGGLMYVARLWI